MPSPLRTNEPTRIVQRILVLRGHRVLLDADLAKLYGVSTSRLNQQVRRNRKRFPADFIFQMTNQELANLMLQSATSSWGGTRKPPVAFTEHGAIMAATVLNSPRAVEMSVYVVRAFVELRQVLASNTELASKLETLEKSVSKLDARTRRQFEEVYEAIRALMAPPAAKTRPIGFTADLGWDRYDALVSINVPSDKARAVVDAMERDMGTTLATKQDLLLLRQELSGMRTEIKQEIESRYTLLDQKIDTLGLKLTVKLGSMLFVGFGLTIAAIRLWV